MSSGSSWASYRGSVARLDFTPAPADDAYFHKSEAFWRLVHSRPELRALRAAPHAHLPPAAAPAPPPRAADDSHYCLHELTELTRTGVTGAAFASGPTGARRAGCEGGDASVATLAPDADALARELTAWDRTHQKWESTPHSRTPAAPPLRAAIGTSGAGER